MAIRGQRFHIDFDLDSDSETDLTKPRTGNSQAGSFLNLVKDIQERVPSDEVKLPSPPTLKASGTGFPAHKKRAKLSAFKQGRAKDATNHDALQTERLNQGVHATSTSLSTENGQSFAPAREKGEDGKTERQRISDENDQKLAQMSTEEIEEARQEIMSGLNPSILEALLKKANIDDGPPDLEPQSTNPGPKESRSNPKKPAKTVTFEDPGTTASSAAQQHIPPPSDPSTPLETTPLSTVPSQPTTKTSPPQLDPSSPNFLSDLHEKYFPSLPADPSTLSWMQPLPAQSSYSPVTPALSPAAVRFDFRGHLLPPRLSAQLPSTMGLHHHSSAPGSAGYTVPELAHLARSTFASQRCIAMQTLGRILYRLGRGDFGQEVEGDEDVGDGGGGALCEGLWNEMEKGRVIDGLVEAAGGDGTRGNRSVWVTAAEAVWLWRKGGGRVLR